MWVFIDFRPSISPTFPSFLSIPFDNPRQIDYLSHSPCVSIIPLVALQWRLTSSFVLSSQVRPQ